MKNVIKFIKENPLQEGEFYNNLNGFPPIFAICKKDSNKIRTFINVDNDYIYFFDEGILYAENAKTGKTRKHKLTN